MFVVKVYDRTNTTLKETIRGDLLTWDVSFSANINWWQWNISIQLNKPLTNNDYTLGDIVKIKKYEEENKSWVDLYMWYVVKIGRKQDTNKSFITLDCLGMASILTENSSSLSYDSKTVWELVRWLIDNINIAIWWAVFTYTVGSIPDWTNMWVWNIDTTTYLDILTTLADSSWSKRYIDGWWVVYFNIKPSTITHYLTNQVDVESIDIDEDMQEMVNSIQVYNDTENYQYSDIVSVGLYWVKYYKEQKNIYGDALELYAQQYVNDRKDPKKETTLIVNRKYNIESIKPWDTVKVRNFDYPFSWIQIEKIQYTQDKIVLYLDRYVSFGEQLKKVF